MDKLKSLTRKIDNETCFMSGNFENNAHYQELEKLGIVALQRLVQEIRLGGASAWRIQMCFSLSSSILDQCIWVPPDSHGNFRVITPRIIEWWDSLNQTN